MECGAVPAGLVGELSTDLAEFGVKDRSIQAGLSAPSVGQVATWVVRIRARGGFGGHVLDCQVFDRDEFEIRGESLCEGMVRCTALLRDQGVKSRELALGGLRSTALRNTTSPPLTPALDMGAIRRKTFW